MYPLTPFDIINGFTSPFREQIYVVSDSQMAELKKARAVEQIIKLEQRAKDYQRNLDLVKMTIEEIQKEHNILPASEATNEPTPTN